MSDPEEKIAPNQADKPIKGAPCQATATKTGNNAKVEDAGNIPHTKKREKRPSFGDDLREMLQSFPCLWAFVLLSVAWFALLHFFGNATLGYVNTDSLFGWLNNNYEQEAGDEHGYLVPVAILGLIWMERRRFIQTPKQTWPLAGIIVLIGILLHLVGYRIQQTRISAAGFFIGWYGISGLLWGKQWLKAVFFPYILFIFCIPLGGLADSVSLPLRMLSSGITEHISQLLGIDVVRQGTMLFNPAKGYEYEVAAACSGLRSLIATLFLAVVYGFLIFKTSWRRAVMVLSGVPLAVAANVTRLLMIIIAGEIWGQKGGMYVHDSSILSLIPYLIAFIGMAILACLLSEKRTKITTPDNASCKNCQ